MSVDRDGPRLASWPEMTRATAILALLLGCSADDAAPGATADAASSADSTQADSGPTDAARGTGGSDSDVPDAPAGDSARVDPTADAGSSDAGSGDAGSGDAAEGVDATGDGETADGETADGETADGATPDATDPDAAPPDLGPPPVGTLLGVARLGADDNHFGIAVEAVGTPFSTRTAPDGAYRLELPAGEVTLRYSHPGYTDELRGPVRVDVDEVLALEEVVLQALPAAVWGRCTVPDEFVDLLPGGVASLEHGAFPVFSVNLDAEGRFRFDNVAPGLYGLRCAIAGFDPVIRAVDANPGDQIDVGDLPMQPAL